MKKVKYFYNPHTLRYEKLNTPFRVRLLRWFGFLAAVVLTSVLLVLAVQKYFPSTNERILQIENGNLKYQVKVLDEKVATIDQQMDAVEQRDNLVYRSIFEAAPLPDSARVRSAERIAELQKVGSMGENALAKSVAQSLQGMYGRVAAQNNSFNAIEKMVANKQELLASIPAIQPVSNKQLERIASGFGMRIDPVYKVPKMHAGLDFTAPIGTPIYATADGTVTRADFSTGGYGNHVIINNGAGYETLFGHMVRVKARAGQKVKRGEIIGWVGSTGKSTGPHCHYEVHKNGEPVDPVFYFYNDITPDQYDRLLKLATSRSQSLD